MANHPLDSVITADRCTLNFVGRDQINQTFNYIDLGNVSAQPGLLRRINDAPVDLLSAHFTGRGNELEFLDQELNKHPGNQPSRCAIYGMPGLGKSQLLLRYAKLSFDKHQYSHIFWTSATTVDKLNQGFVKILDLIDHRGRYLQDQPAKLTSARLWLEGPDGDDDINWLLLVDNVQADVLGFLRLHLPRTNARGKILFTTRTAEIAQVLVNAAGEQHTVLKLHTLELRESANLLVEDAGLDADINEAEELVKCVGRLPLAVVHAASFMKQTGTTLGDMVRLYKSNRKIEVIGWEHNLNAYEERSVAATFSHQFDQLNQQSRDISNLLKVFSFLDPETVQLEMIVKGAEQLSLLPADPSPSNITSHASSSLPTSLLPSLRPLPKPTPLQKLKEWNWHRKGKNRSMKTHADNTKPPVPPTHVDEVKTSRISSESNSLISLILSPIEFQKAVQTLHDLSLLERRSMNGDSSVWMHDLVQFMMRESTRTEEAHQAWLRLCVSLVYGAFQHIQDLTSPQSWAECEKFMPHLRSLNEYWDDACGMNAELTKARGEIAIYLRSCGRYDEAEKLCKQVLNMQEKYLEANHQDTLGSMNQLALVYNAQGRYKEGEELIKQVLAKREELLGAQHEDTLTSMNNLATTYNSQGRYDDAEGLYKQVLAEKERTLGAEDSYTLLSMNNLAMTYRLQGRGAEAEPLLKQVLASRERVLGPDHSETLLSMNNLGMAYRSQGRIADAEPLLKQVLASREKLLGPDHPDTLLSMNNLATTYISQGRHDEAEALLMQVLASNKMGLGADHPSTLTSMINLAFVYKSQERYDEATVLFKAALAGREKHFGSDHPHTRRTARNLSRLQQDRMMGGF